MKTTKTNLIEDIAVRAYNEIGYEKISSLLSMGNIASENETFSNLIRAKVNTYLIEDERNLYLRDNLSFNESAMNMLVLEVSLRVTFTHTKQVIENLVELKQQRLNPKH